MPPGPFDFTGFDYTAPPPPLGAPPPSGITYPWLGINQKTLGTSGQGTPGQSGLDKWMQYATLASMLGSAGAATGMAFRPWFAPPPPVAPGFYPTPPVTAPHALNYLAAIKAHRG